MALPVLAISAVVAAGSAIASSTAQAKAASNQATLAAQTANFNANVDIAQAQQEAMNANANIAAKRQEDRSYLSTQRAALAASGVLSDTGSPMEVQATTAGRMEQDIQQYWANTQESESTLYAAAQEGVYEGAQEATAYHLEGAADIFAGIGQLANIAGSSAAQKGFGYGGQ